MTRHVFDADSPWLDWHGLGGWNVYFLAKFALLWGGYLNFHPLINLVFAAFLIFPLPRAGWRRARHWLALPVGAGIFYHDTWLPGIESIRAQGSQVFSFTLDYWTELLGRFINWEMVGAGFVLLTLYLFIAQWLRFTPWILLALLWLWVSPQVSNPFASSKGTSEHALNTSREETRSSVLPMEGQLDQSAPPTNENLNAYLDDFYREEQERLVHFPESLPAQATPFDVLIINVCSLAWHDVEASGLTGHPVWSHFDIRFNRFNSATSYSGPSSIRLLRASCGQTSHQGLYVTAPKQCLLFENLAQLGFAKQVAMDHSGDFGNYLTGLQQYAGLDVTPMDKKGLAHDLASFDGEPIYRGDALFDRWLNERTQSQAARNVTFFNLIALHDGNRYVASRQIAPYKARLKTLLDQLDDFMTTLEQSGRKVAVVMVPEHGAALTGDKMQMAGLRDIPSPSITQVPVGIALLGTKAPHEATRNVDTPSSFLAVSELVSRLVGKDVFGSETIDWDALLGDLPQTPPVSENQGSVVIEYQGKYHIKLGQGDWVPYPQ
ncbi:cellulose biosynthesis protein BcsG [Aeromonas caviae]|uniref:cellulose biosynthesis protein BcsG n=1 Tax=Aeromonas caviae TaxID=648 RepID=UPI001CC77539|nr:cellulose biosynthesis protein BcsG [Aeromonas caviae]MDH1635193.1 cellulose biosynthesis protein BcsG [Aeromonas caviae]MDH1993926.1 cellulose biosynthesis protein BcsG [Aeromonas caviae]GJA85450.1 membrane protein [Aeromonas caviae]GJA89358.1 membrane protein [Aeromonas caviae]GJB06718.1 membrane protein [Aeromonas caviae]